MKTLVVRPSSLSGEIQIPSSKSQTHRAILLGSLGKNVSLVYHYLNSPDCLAMMEACRYLGAKITAQGDHLQIEGIGGNIWGAENVINAHNSGIVLRFISAIAALGSHPIVITGDESIRHQRPMHVLLKTLKQLGVQAISTRGDGFAPVIIKGPLRPGQGVIEDGSDSQNISSLLMAAIFLKGTLELEVHQTGEKPWIDLTLDWLKRLKVPYENHRYKNFKVQGIGSYDGFEYAVPGDWSSAAFPIAAAIVTRSEVVLNNLSMHDLQGDKAIVNIFKQMGAGIEIDEQAHSIHVYPRASLKGITVDINDCIDALPILAVVACYAEGQTSIINAAVARQKECDRIACIATELNKMGALIQESHSGLCITGNPLKGASVFSHKDHRMAMALAVAGMGAKGETAIYPSNCIEKTYPTFVQDFKRLGAHIEEV
ncbi:3-phosphoshikimate 1-carboxyvinyltransferase [Neochlamydia sp. S13]|uniref:3-phosphoshikimate 1-carboxyvinyltransferase n=1 Tax=Neochlamydia sp. S13 TaxID=1353976 RepID=UPI0005A8CD7F|nr:3-phosphoshikimate 1-carboxyvinyltransferase [Neochlamydia sp. S13]BBI17156.1 3-phosphoshikimate 1-carboxyvinyltransferase [Neochlamydia sp. S13]